MLILNASPLIHLVKAGCSWIIEELSEDETLLTTSEVLNEILRGKEKGFVDAFVIEKLVSRGIIKVIDVKREKEIEKIAPNLHAGEVSVLSLAKKLGGTAIVDEASAREVARILNINAHGSLFLPILLFKKGKIKKGEVIKVFKKAVKTGWRISVEDYEKILEELGRM